MSLVYLSLPYLRLLLHQEDGRDQEEGRGLQSLDHFSRDEGLSGPWEASGGDKRFNY